MTKDEEKKKMGFQKVQNKKCSTCASREYVEQTTRWSLTIYEVKDQCGLSETKFSVKKTSVCDSWIFGNGVCVGQITAT